MSVDDTSLMIGLVLGFSAGLMLSSWAHWLLSQYLHGGDTKP